MRWRLPSKMFGGAGAITRPRAHSSRTIWPRRRPREQVRSQIVISALKNALATHLGVVAQGRKTIIFVSEGFAAVRRAATTIRCDGRFRARTANRRASRSMPIDPRAFDPVPVDNGAGGRREGVRAGRLARARGRYRWPARCARPLMCGSAWNASWPMRELRTNVVTFQPAHQPTFGVPSGRLRVARPNVTMHARRVLVASADDLLLKRTERAPHCPGRRRQPMRHASPLIRPWFGIERGSGGQGESDGRVRVSFVWEPAPAVPGDRTSNRATRAGVREGHECHDGSTVLRGSGCVPSNVTMRRSFPDAAVEAAFDVKPGALLVQIGSRRRPAPSGHGCAGRSRGGLAGPVEVGTPKC